MLPLFSISLELEVHQDLSKGDAFLWDPLPDSLFCLGRFTVESSKWWDFEKPPRQLLLPYMQCTQNTEIFRIQDQTNIEAVVVAPLLEQGTS